MVTAGFTTSAARSKLSRIRLPGVRACAPAIGSILRRCRCAPVDTIVCASLLSQWGGVTYVTAGREATLVVRPVAQRTHGARSQAHRRAAAHQSPARRRRRARHDRRRSGGARRGLAGVDAPGPHDLGLLHLRDPVQSRPGVSVLGLAPALASSASGAERHFPGDAGRGLYRAPALRTEGAGRSRRRTMADDRARPAGSGDCVPGRGARQHGDRLRRIRPKSGRGACC